MKKWHVTGKKIENDVSVQTDTIKKIPKLTNQKILKNKAHKESQAFVFVTDNAQIFSIEFKKNSYEEVFSKQKKFKINMFSKIHEGGYVKRANTLKMTVTAAHKEIYKQLKQFALESQLEDFITIKNNSKAQELKFTIHPPLDLAINFIEKLQLFLPFSRKVKALVMEYLFNNLEDDKSKTFLDNLIPDLKSSMNSSTMWNQSTQTDDGLDIPVDDKNDNTLRRDRPGLV